MAKVHLEPWLWALGGAALLVGVTFASRLSIAGWAAGVAYLAVSSALLSVGLARRGMPRLGPANSVTAARSALVGAVTALVVTSFGSPMPPALLVALVVPALALDAVDGWVARRTRSVTPLGARFDMEVDAFLLLVLSVSAGPMLGWWTLAIGLMRYAFVAAARVFPWLGSQLPPRYWRKVVTAVCGIALALAASGLAPLSVADVAVGIALALLVESFGRDVIWLVRARPARATARPSAPGTPASPDAAGGRTAAPAAPAPRARRL
jgi:phosphatidylglycerophosphate synthase